MTGSNKQRTNDKSTNTVDGGNRADSFTEGYYVAKSGEGCVTYVIKSSRWLNMLKVTVSKHRRIRTLIIDPDCSYKIFA